MANSMPFNSINADRPYKAEDWAWYFGTFIGNGVFPKPETGLQVVANEGMKITVNEGKAFINGYAFKNPSNYEITLDTADGALARIDRVVVRWDLVNRDMYIDVLKGTVSSSPKAVDVTRNSEIYELALADVTVSKGVTSITQAYITDQRFNSDLCGIVKGTVEGIDTSVIIAQFEDFVKTYQEDQLAEFEAWVESIKDVLDENAAGNLQLQIDDVNEKATEHIENTANPHNVTAEQTHFDKNISGLNSDNVQGAIDDVVRTIGYTVSKNYLPNPINNFTQYGITGVVNNDKSFTLNGTNTRGYKVYLNLVGDGPSYIYEEIDGLEDGVEYTISGCPSGGGVQTYGICAICEKKDGTTYSFDDYGEGNTFTHEDGNEYRIYVGITNNVTLSNLTFCPMIKRADDNTDYTPYISVKSEIGRIIADERLNATSKASVVTILKSISNLPKGTYIATFRTIGMPSSFVNASIWVNAIERDVNVSFSNIATISPQCSATSIFNINAISDVVEFKILSGVDLTNRAGQQIRIVRIA